MEKESNVIKAQLGLKQVLVLIIAEICVLSN